MDPEGTCLLTYCSINAYGKPRLLLVHKYHYAPPRIVLQPAAGRCAGRCATRTAPAAYSTSEGSMLSFKLIT